LAVVGKTAEELVARADTFRTLAEIQLDQADFKALNIGFRPESATILAEAYFALSEAYKRKRLHRDSRTEWSKAGALVAATVSVVNPLRPSGRADDPAWIYVNPAFGMLCAYAHAQHVFSARPFDERRRLLQSLQSLRLPCLDPIISEGNATNGNFRSKWEIEISDGEMSQLDALVTSFVLLRQNDDLLAEQERLRGP
jgi:hypothetical protein